MRPLREMWVAKIFGLRGLSSALLVTAVAGCGGPSAAPETAVASGGGGSSAMSGGAASPAQGAGVYVSDKLPYSFTVPEGWEPGPSEEGPGGRIIESWSSEDGSIAVGSTAVPAGATPEDFVNELIDGRTECSAIDVPIDEATLGGEPAFRFEYSCRSSHFSADVATFHDGRRYVVTVETQDPDTSSKTLDDVVQSFKFTASP